MSAAQILATEDGGRPEELAERRAAIYLEALLQVEAHHVERNQQVGRPEYRSKTLQIVRNAIVAARAVKS